MHKGIGNDTLVADFRNDEGLRIRKEPVSPNLTSRKHSETDISTMPPLVMNTLTEATGNRAGSSKEFIKSVKNIHNSIGQIRRLTPMECEKLQGFHGNWTKFGIINGKTVEISDTQRYKMLGNAVTTNVITAIIKHII